ncbi:hypothetical protein CPLU01_03415 [Colletotrichum plurivorum]|uniref:Uncharacterized protein n=1 Tax=Colletotrichum plurivorum TaxID=2175906 RepID=A0A8H6KSG3_9PEZI|nr:hypothetical protein CPLU01_03415 [Colletotrichum plurivorum]
MEPRLPSTNPADDATHHTHLDTPSDNTREMMYSPDTVPQFQVPELISRLELDATPSLRLSPDELSIRLSLDDLALCLEDRFGLISSLTPTDQEDLHIRTEAEKPRSKSEPSPSQPGPGSSSVYTAVSVVLPVQGNETKSHLELHPTTLNPQRTGTRSAPSWTIREDSRPEQSGSPDYVTGEKRPGFPKEERKEKEEEGDDVD